MEDRRRRVKRGGRVQVRFFSRGGFYCLDARHALVSESTVFRSTDTCADPFVVPRARHSTPRPTPSGTHAREESEETFARVVRARTRTPLAVRDDPLVARYASRAESSSRNDATTVVLLSEPMSPTTAQDRRLADLEAAELHARARARRALRASRRLPFPPSR